MTDDKMVFLFYTQGGDVSPMIAQDKKGVWRPAAAVEIGETYAYLSGIAIDKWLSLMKPNQESAGMMKLDADNLNDLIHGARSMIDYAPNSQFMDDVFAPLEKAKKLTTEAIRERILALKPQTEKQTKDRGAYLSSAFEHTHPNTFGSKNGGVFTDRALAAFAATLEAAEVPMYQTTVTFLAHYLKANEAPRRPSANEQLKLNAGGRPGTYETYER